MCCGIVADGAFWSYYVKTATGWRVVIWPSGLLNLNRASRPPPRNRQQSVYVSLHQSHLPKLDTLGIVEYDTQSKEVSLADTADEVIGYLESEAPPTGWSTIQFCLGVLGIILVLGADTGVGLLASHPPQNWAYIVLGLMVMSAGIQTVRLGTSLLERSPWT